MASNVWRRNMSRSRESTPRGLRKQQTKTTFAARARTLNGFKKIIMGGQGFALLAHSLLVLPDNFFMTKRGTWRHQSRDQNILIVLIRF